MGCQIRKAASLDVKHDRLLGCDAEQLEHGLPNEEREQLELGLPDKEIRKRSTDQRVDELEISPTHQVVMWHLEVPGMQTGVTIWQVPKRVRLPGSRAREENKSAPESSK